MTICQNLSNQLPPKLEVFGNSWILATNGINFEHVEMLIAIFSINDQTNFHSVMFRVLQTLIRQNHLTTLGLRRAVLQIAIKKRNELVFSIINNKSFVSIHNQIHGTRTNVGWNKVIRSFIWRQINYWKMTAIYEGKYSGKIQLI